MADRSEHCYIVYRKASARSTGWKKDHWSAEKLGPIWYAYILEEGWDNILIYGFLQPI